MVKKCKIIREIFTDNNENNYSKLVLFTKSFKVIGEFVHEEKIEGLITLKHAKIYSYVTNCECETTHEYHEIEWLNIFAENIIAFSFKE